MITRTGNAWIVVGVLAVAIAAAVSLLPLTAGPAQAACAYFEDDEGTFYIDLETGSWRLVFPYDVSGTSVDELRLTDSKGRFGDTTESGAELRGSFQIDGPGWVTFRDRSTDRQVRIDDRSVQGAACN
jgi:hypothetical protein